MMTDRERLADLLAFNPTERDLALKKADELLAAGVTLPPAPKPPLLTEQQVGECWDRVMPDSWDRWDVPDPRDSNPQLTAFANAAAEAAIRGRVKEKTENMIGTETKVVWLGKPLTPSRMGAYPRDILALFGLEGE